MEGTVSRTSRVTVFVLVGTLVAAGAISALLLVRDSDDAVGPPTMPNVVGQSWDTVGGVLAAAGVPFNFEYRSVANDRVPENLIATQNPAAGARVPSSGDNWLEVSAGGPTITFEQLPAQAQALAKTLRFYDDKELILVTTTPNIQISTTGVTM